MLTKYFSSSIGVVRKSTCCVQKIGKVVGIYKKRVLIRDNFKTISTKDNNYKLGCVYIRCTKRNIFCVLTDTLTRKVKISCSLKLPGYLNEFNVRENPYTRGLLLGKVFGSKLVSFGYRKIIVYVMGLSKGRSGVVRSLSKSSVDISSMVLLTCGAHNGCRPIKSRRKKFRTKTQVLK